MMALFAQSQILIPADQSGFNISYPHNSIHGHHTAIIRGASSSFRIILRDDSCHLEKLSSLASRESCVYGVNGGPFSSYVFGGCVGSIISDGKIIEHANVQHDMRDNFLRHIKHSSVNDISLSFGLTYSNDWIIGNIPFELMKNIKELVTGLGKEWLVFNSTMIISEPDNHRAPRTAIGVKNSGELVLLQMDGCEYCVTREQRNRGATLKEISSELITVGVSYAINLDGGGSSSTFESGQVISTPTCLDYVDLICERPIASAICIGVK